MKNQLNALQELMRTKTFGSSNNGPQIVPVKTAEAAATWLRKNQQTENGKSFEPVKK